MPNTKTPSRTNVSFYSKNLQGIRFNDEGHKYYVSDNNVAAGFPAWVQPHWFDIDTTLKGMPMAKFSDGLWPNIRSAVLRMNLTTCGRAKIMHIFELAIDATRDGLNPHSTYDQGFPEPASNPYDTGSPWYGDMLEERTAEQYISEFIFNRDSQITRSQFRFRIIGTIRPVYTNWRSIDEGYWFPQWKLTGAIDVTSLLRRVQQTWNGVVGGITEVITNHYIGVLWILDNGDGQLSLSNLQNVNEHPMGTARIEISYDPQVYTPRTPL